MLARGAVRGIASPGCEFAAAVGDNREDRKGADCQDHAAAVGIIFGWLSQQELLPEAVGHRVVHGGEAYTSSVRLDDHVLAALDALVDLAPLHNASAVAVIRASLAHFRSVPMFAVFDTAFHRTLPEVARRYAIPDELASRFSLRRFGFHGIAHQYLAERFAALSSRPSAGQRLITLQLGSGCSACALRDGRSVDTSMGYTPLEGLMMGTRCGDLDPSAVLRLLREGTSPEQVEDLLNRHSGLLGVSGLSADARQLEKQYPANAGARLAVDLFCYRVRKCIGSYLAVLEGADAIVFSGGIGENSAFFRRLILEPLAWAGAVLDPARNAAAVGSESRITTEAATLPAFVIPANEEHGIADEVLQLASAKRT